LALLLAWGQGFEKVLIFTAKGTSTLCLKKTGPLLHFQITPTILFQYQQNLVQRIVN